MNFIIGRNNLALTIFVPFDCSNNCYFCTSKAGYKTNPANLRKVKEAICEFFTDYRFPITDVVFTGGEPMENIPVLKELIDLIPSDKNVFINTSFINKNVIDFCNLVNNEDKIKGISISRHGDTYEEDYKLLRNICPDVFVTLFTKPVRINCVVGNLIKEEQISKIIERWKKLRVLLSFRKDFTTVKTDLDLHNPYDYVPRELIRLGYTYEGHTQCNVCDTTRFRWCANSYVQYHKGFEHTALEKDGTLEINDLIIFQDGRFAYDWSDCREEVVEELRAMYRIIPYCPPMDMGTIYKLNEEISFDFIGENRCGSGGCGIVPSGYSGCGIGGCG